MANRLPPLHALRTFEAVARLGSVTAAADDLCITHSAVSHQITKLEEWLQIELVEREGRGIRLTEAGQRYKEVVCDAFSRMAAETKLLRRGRKEDEVRVSSLPMFAVSWLLPNLHDFWAHHPDVEVSIHYSRGTQAIDPAATDLAIRFGDPDDFPDFAAQALLQGDAIPVCSRNYRDALGLAGPADILRTNLLHDEDRAFWRSWLSKAGLDPAAAEGGTLLPDGNLTLASVMAGEGVGLLRRATIERQLRSHSLVPLSDISIDGEFRYLLLSPRGGSARRNVLVFKNWLRSRALTSEALTG